MRNIDNFTKNKILRVFKGHLQCEVEVLTKESKEFSQYEIENDEDFILKGKNILIPFKRNSYSFFYLVFENKGFDAIFFVQKIKDIWNKFLNPLQYMNEIKMLNKVFDITSKKLQFVFNKDYELISLNKEIHRNMRVLFNFGPKKLEACKYKMNEIFETQLDLLKFIKKAIDKALKEGKQDEKLEGDFSEWMVFLNLDVSQEIKSVILVYDWENKVNAY